MQDAALAETDWGPFGRPLFDDPAARALSRVGVVDVGSNSVRMVVFDGAARSPAYFFNEKVMAGLGSGLAVTGKLNPEGRERARDAILRFARLAQGMGAEPLTMVATAALREAEDGPDFQAEIERLTGLRLWIIDGKEEARLSAQGVLLGWPGARGLVCDIGGSSMELAEIGDGEVGRRASTRLGPLRLKSLNLAPPKLARTIETEVGALADRFGTGHSRLFLVGGSWRAIARLDMERRSYPLHVQHEYRMRPDDVAATVRWIADHEIADMRAMTGIGEARMSLVPLASQVLGEVVRQLEPAEIAVSSYGIREGLLFDKMPRELRDRDPLIEACRFAEKKDARIPGFGRALYDFVKPLWPGASEEFMRIVRAACHLHDVGWRAHPDYRHEACFDMVTRANLGGLTHRERVFLGLSLLHRYKNSRSGTRLADLLDILTPEDIRNAEVLGRAMRFGAMFSAETPGSLGELMWHPQRKLLSLSLTPRATDLFGEVAEARLNALANALDAETRVRLPEDSTD